MTRLIITPIEPDAIEVPRRGIDYKDTIVIDNINKTEYRRVFEILNSTEVDLSLGYIEFDYIVQISITESRNSRANAISEYTVYITEDEFMQLNSIFDFKF